MESDQQIILKQRDTLSLENKQLCLENRDLKLELAEIRDKIWLSTSPAKREMNESFDKSLLEEFTAAKTDTAFDILKQIKQTMEHQQSRREKKQQCDKCARNLALLQNYGAEIDLLSRALGEREARDTEQQLQIQSMLEEIEHQKQLLKELKREKRSAEMAQVQFKSKCEQLESVVKLFSAGKDHQALDNRSEDCVSLITPRSLTLEEPQFQYFHTESA